MKLSNRLLASALLFASPVVLTACGGGGSGGGNAVIAPTPTPTPTPTPSSTWRQGVYDPASTFKDKCQTPRTGVDIEGNRFTDVKGTLADEKLWLRSWTHETYLWNDEVTDQNPASFSTPVAYFEVLKTNATTASGAAKDNFHFYQSTEEYLQDRNSAGGSGYGASFAVTSPTPPREVRVRYTEPNSPASNATTGTAPFIRGARILRADGVDVVNDNTQAGVDTINNAIFPATSGETHSFVVQDVGGAERTISVTSADIVRAPVNKTRIIDQGTEKVGYILFNTFSPFSSEKSIADAVTEMANAGVSDLVLDLRYNGGGLLAVASQLGYMIAGDTRTNNKTFETLKFNDDAGNRDPVTGEFNDPVPFYSTGLGFSLASGVPLDTLNLNRVYILSTGGTCSASESVINSLLGIDVEVVLIGETTCGKPYGFYPTDNCGTTFYTIQFEGVNDKGQGGYSDGFTPAEGGSPVGLTINGCQKGDHLDFQLGANDEPMLATALNYRLTGTCQPATAVAAAGEPAQSARSLTIAVPDQNGLAIATTPLSPTEEIERNSRDLTLPGGRKL